MTTTDVRSTEAAPEAPPDPHRAPDHTRRRWVAVAVAGVLALALLGFLIGNETQANTQFDEAHQGLTTTKHRLAGVDARLADVRAQLADVQGQVTLDSTTLASETSTLQGVLAALAASQANDSRLAGVITQLHTCLGGVQQALNALSVGDQPHALAALRAVAPSCQQAASADG